MAIESLTWEKDKNEEYMFETRNRKKRQPSAMRKKRFEGCSSLHPASEGCQGRPFAWKRPRLYGFPLLPQKRLPQYLKRNFRQAYGRRFFGYFFIFFHFSLHSFAWLQCKGYHWIQHEILRLLMYGNPGLDHLLMLKKFIRTRARRRCGGPTRVFDGSERGENTFLLITLPFVDRFLKN